MGDIFDYLCKTAGGPGSGKIERATRYITYDYTDLKLSPLMSIGKRKAFMDSREPIEKDVKIPLSKIKYVCQEKYVPPKLEKFINNPDLLELPVDLLKDKDEQYHVLDGNHRFLAAKLLKKKVLRANVYSSEGLEKAASVKNSLIVANLLGLLANPGVSKGSEMALNLQKVPVVRELSSMLPFGMKADQLILDSTGAKIPLNEILDVGLKINSRAKSVGPGFSLKF